VKSIQEYIDERRVWADGTNLPAAPMTNMQWLIWSLAAAGKFFEGYVVFMTGVALPLISREFGIGSAEHGLIGAASLLGILVGAVGLGGMSDRFGRKPMFIVEMIIFVAFLVLLILCTNFLSVARLLIRKPQYPSNIKLLPHPALAAEGKRQDQGFLALLSRQYRRATIFASVPWFLQDLGTYGIGIFTPTILAATIGGPVEHIRTVGDLISDDIVAAKGSALITMLLIVGIVFAVLLADRLGRIALQVIGFIGCAAGLLLASFSFYVTGGTKTILIFAGFMLFNFMTNLGPNAQTYFSPERSSPRLSAVKAQVLPLPSERLER
jgi:MFS family permease